LADLRSDNFKCWNCDEPGQTGIAWVRDAYFAMGVELQTPVRLNAKIRIHRKRSKNHDLRAPGSNQMPHKN